MLYNAACSFCLLHKKPEALNALKKARDAGFRDSDWARRDPDLALLKGDPEFDKLYPPNSPGSKPASRRKHKAWGVSPRIENQNTIESAKRATEIC